MRHGKTAAVKVEHQANGLIQALSARLQGTCTMNKNHGLAGFILCDSDAGDDSKVARQQRRHGEPEQQGGKRFGFDHGNLVDIYKRKVQGREGLLRSLDVSGNGKSLTVARV